MKMQREVAVGVLIGAVLSFQTAPAFAGSDTPSSAIIDNPCPPQRPLMSAQAQAAMLKPGAKPLVIPPAQYEAYRRMKEAERAKDFANVCLYKGDNANVARPPRIVFMGDSITDTW